MKADQKNRLIGLDDAKGSPVRGRIGLIVERDGEIGTPRCHADSDDSRIGNDDGPHRQIVRSDRRDQKATAVRRDDRAADAERISRRPGRSGDQHPVAPVGGYHLIVDENRGRNHVRTLALNSQLVECERIFRAAIQNGL